MVENVNRDGEKVWIDGVEGFSASHWASSVHGSQARIVETVGESLGYDDLVGYSAFIYRVSWHKQGCPSGGHPCCGFMCMKNNTQTLPWRLRSFEDFPWSKPKAGRAAFEAEARAAIKDSIDRGVPVHYGGEEDGLIIGYADEGRRWWCVHPYYKNGEEAFWHDEKKGMGGFAGGKWPWVIAVWLEPKPSEERPSERDLLIDSLKQAVEMWNTEIREDYYVGEAAYKHWLEFLREVEAGEIEDPKGWMQGNGWCFDVLAQNRRIAGRWLREKADLIGDESAAEHLRLAANQYAAIPDICLEGIEGAWILALPPNQFEEWTSEMRQTQIARLEAARERDRAAIAEIRKTLEKVGRSTSL